MPTDYELHKKNAAERQRRLSACGREIGPLPPVADPARRERALAGGLLEFASTYFPTRFPWPFAGLHSEAGARLDRCSLAGGRYAAALPRGSGKTTLAEVAVIRNVVGGLRRFVLLLQATQPLAARSLKKIQRELEANDLLAADFPESCYPIRALERIHNRSKGQLLDGEPTRIEWRADGITLPTVAGAASSGSAISVAGITGAIRGLSIATSDGGIMRPDMVLIDDVQTRESASSHAQTADRESIILDDVLGLAGPGVEMAAVMLCTVIAPGDLSDRFLSDDRHPEWRGQRVKMIEQWPARVDLWDQYAELRRESLRTGDEGRTATEFYAANRAEMDAGGVVSWPERMKPSELSGLQSAMNLWQSNPRGFKAEYQNAPEPEGGAAGAKELDPQRVAARVAGTDRLTVPRECSRLTAFVDVGGQLHWFAVVAWDDTFGGAVVDYGTWPRQTRAVFAADDPRPGLSDLYPGLDESARVYAGLRDLTADVLGRTYVRDGSTSGDLRIERCLIDCGWSADAVHRFCRASAHAGVIYPSKGIGRTISARGVSEWTTKKPGERFGYHWLLGTSETGKGRMVKFDPDAWKTFLYERLTTPEGSRGSLGFWGRDAARHEQIGQHCAAEAAEPVTIRGATFDKWQVKPHRPDNHLWDCLIGCAVAASVAGLTWSPGAAAGVPDAPAVKRAKRDALAEWKRARGIT